MVSLLSILRIRRATHRSAEKCPPSPPLAVPPCGVVEFWGELGQIPTFLGALGAVLELRGCRLALECPQVGAGHLQGASVAVLSPNPAALLL